MSPSAIDSVVSKAAVRLLYFDVRFSNLCFELVSKKFECVIRPEATIQELTNPTSTLLTHLPSCILAPSVPWLPESWWPCMRDGQSCCVAQQLSAVRDMCGVSSLTNLHVGVSSRGRLPRMQN